MRKTKVDKLIKKFAADARREGEAAGRKRVLDELTFTLAAPENALELSPRPEQPYFRVALTPRRPVSLESYMKDPPWLQTPARMANFVATRKTWASGEGHMVCWYEWEFKGVSF